MEKKHCRGCKDNFYNGNNPLGVSQCWSFDPNKKLVTRFVLSVDAPMNQRGCYF